MKNLSQIKDPKDLATKEYVDGKLGNDIMKISGHEANKNLVTNGAGKVVTENKPVALKNPQPIKFTGGAKISYDGSKAETVAIPEIDNTLKVAGKAADASKVGEHINNHNNPHKVTAKQIGAMCLPNDPQGKPIPGTDGDVAVSDGTGGIRWEPLLNLVEKILPKFNITGAVVACSPIDILPWQVFSHISQKVVGNKVNLTVCGKNLFNKAAKPEAVGKGINADGTYTNASGWNVYKIHVPESVTITAYGNKSQWTIGLCCFDKSNKRVGGISFENRLEVTYVTPPGTTYCLYSVGEPDQAQLVIGDNIIGYSPYQGSVYIATVPANTSNGKVDWIASQYINAAGKAQKITVSGTPVPVSGENTLYSDSGDTTVMGSTTFESASAASEAAIMARIDKQEAQSTYTAMMTDTLIGE